MNCKDCCQDCQRIGCDIEVNCTGYVGKAERIDFCKTCVYSPPSSLNGKPCTQCDPESSFQNCYVKKEADSKPTNADRIRNMGDIELANFLSGLTNGCVNCPMYDEWQIGTADECGKHCNSSWQNWVKRESESE